MIYLRLVKPVADRLLAVAGLAVLSPVLLLVWVAIRIRMGSPVVFHQIRVGRHDTLFRFSKFRTMTNARGIDGELLPDEQRLTRLGQFLRSSSLDELPQLWNIIRGEMSLIGPRPLLPEYLPRYSAFQRRRHEVKPGITGLAQVQGRNEISWSRKFELDVRYVDHLTAGLDLRILLMTLRAVLGKKGISQKGHATMSPFLGADTPADERHE